MQLGGVLLASGMVLEFGDGQYLYGDGPVRFTVETVVETREEWGCSWVILTGLEKAPQGPWKPRRIQVRVSALKAALTGSARPA